MIPKPTFSPLSNTAGKVHYIDFQGAAKGDYVIMKENDCSGANVSARSDFQLRAEGDAGALKASPLPPQPVWQH